MSDRRSQTRAAGQAARRQARRERELSAKPWDHSGSTEDKYRRWVAHLHKLLKATQSGPPSESAWDELKSHLEWALGNPDTYAAKWFQKRGPDWAYDIAPGVSGMNLAAAEREYVSLCGGTHKSAVYRICEYLIAGPVRSSLSDYLTGDYEPGEWRIKAIAKDNGKTREIRVSDFPDAILEQVLTDLVGPFLEHDLSDSAIGYRKGIGHLDALHRMFLLSETHNCYRVLTADIKGAFDNIRPDLVEDVLTEQIPSRGVVTLIMSLLSSKRHPDPNQPEMGIPQGCALSPIILNSVLNKFFDQEWRRRYPHWPMLRYADDICILGRSKADVRNAHRAMIELLGSIALELNPVKTRNRWIKSSSIKWLGHQIYHNGEQYQVSLPENFNQRVGDCIAEHAHAPSYQSIELALEGLVAYHGPAWDVVDITSTIERICSIAENVNASIDSEQIQNNLSRVALRERNRWRDKRRSLYSRLISLPDAKHKNDATDTVSRIEPWRRPMRESVSIVPGNPEEGTADSSKDRSQEDIPTKQDHQVYATVAAPRPTELFWYGEAIASNREAERKPEADLRQAPGKQCIGKPELMRPP